jgi:hypothetical protein
MATPIVPHPNTVIVRPFVDRELAMIIDNLEPKRSLDNLNHEAWIAVRFLWKI